MIPVKALLPHLLLALMGALSVFSFAPLYLFPLMWLSLAALTLGIQQSDSPKMAGWRGFSFGLGYFLANIHWIFISLNTFGGMPVLMAAGGILVLAAYMALFPALAGWLTLRLSCPERWRLLLLPTTFTLTEWLRGWLFTGFPWASAGYSQSPLTPLAGFAPIGGVYLISWLLFICVAILVARPKWRAGWGIVASIWIAGWGLNQIEWTKPVGAPVRVSLVQGNIPQNLKWQNEFYLDSLKTYLRLTEKARGQLVVLPETAIPSFISDVPDWYPEMLRDAVAARKADLILGIPIAGSHEAEYYNAVTVMSDPALPMYKKQHLVPFGEFIPLPWLFDWIYRFMDMPLSGFSRGAVKQQPFALASGQIAANICYEDVFGREIINALPEATMLVNLSNLAWFDGSWAAAQHAQMSQTRALETGRYMLRATNTGVTAIIDEKGRFKAVLPERTAGILEGKAENRSGMPPYAWAADTPLLAGLTALLLVLVLLGRRNQKLRASQPVVQETTLPVNKGP